MTVDPNDSGPFTPLVTPAKKSHWRWVLPIVTGVVGAVLGAGISVGVMSSAQNAEKTEQASEASAAAAAAADAKQAFFGEVLDACSLSGTSGADVGDEGNTLIIDNKGSDDYDGVGLESLLCVLDEAGVPDSVRAEMADTTSMAGRQSAEWDGMSASWSYHPDNGLDVVLTQS